MIIFATDPGEKNNAYSLVKITPNKVTLLETGMITETIVNLTHNERKMTRKAKTAEPPLQLSFGRYRRRVADLMRAHGPDHFVAERFQTRGVKSRSAETVSMMNGIAIYLADSRGISYRLIMAASWKNWINKIHPLDELYVLGKELGLTNHTVDTLCIALYEYIHFLTAGNVLTAKTLIKIVTMAGGVFTTKIGIRSKVRVKWSDGKLYSAAVEKISGKYATIRWYSDNSTDRVLLSKLIPWK